MADMNKTLKFAVMDTKGIIETAANIETLIENEEGIRADNPDIEGDLMFIEIHYRSK